jgi:iron complex outermembrane recepter protein
MNTRLAFAFLASTSSLLLAAPGHAQDAAPAPTPAGGDTAAADEAAGASSDIVVTGTRIVRDGYTAPTPVTVATTEDLIKSTPSNLPDALNKLPQFQNSLSPSKSALNFSNLPIHGNLLNLRGLGTTGVNPKGPLRTLILFDGIRVPSTTYIGTVDTDVIPNLLIQRVDVVTGGASAGYGSDAVAGVVNFVLDKKFTGLKGVVQAGVSQRGDNSNKKLGAAYGADFGGGRGHILVSGEYFSNDGMLRNERATGRAGYGWVGSTVGCVNPSPTTNPTGCSPGGSLNPYMMVTDIRIAAASDTGKIAAASNAGNPFVNYVVNADGSLRPFVNGTTTGSAGIQVGGDGYRIPSDTSAIAPVKNYHAFGRLGYDVTDDINAYVQGTWSRSDLQYDSLANSFVLPTGAFIYKGNPYLPAALDAALPTANDFYSIGQYNSSGPKPHVKERTDFWMATAGLDGKISNFSWKLAYTHGQSKTSMDQSGLYDWKKTYAALDAVRDPATGNIVCRVLLNPAVASQYTGCSPLNVLQGDPSKTTPAGYAYATGTSRYDATTKEDSVNLDLSGSLFDLPAGPVDLAVGVEWRRQTLDLTSNADPATLVGTATDKATFDAQTAAIRAAYFAGLRGVPSSALYYWLTNVGVARGKQTIKEAYAELAVPILKDTPFFQELSLNGAARITDYSTSGTVKTWKIGGVWRPVSDLLFRAGYSRDIRAPNLFELFRGDQSAVSIINDPLVNGVGSGQNVNVAQLSGGNRNLKPEIAKTLTIGGVLQPSFMRGFSLAVDYYSIKLNGAIDALGAQQIVNNCSASGGTAPECSLITRATSSPTSPLTLIRISDANIAFIKTAGLDIDASYRTELGNGNLGIRLYANYLDKFDTAQFTGAPTLHYAGINVVGSNPVGYPHWRGSLQLDYQIGGFGATITEQYIGKMRLGIPGSPQNFLGDTSVSPVGYTDLSLRYDIKQGGGTVQIFGVVNNLFDKKPPLIPGITPGVNLPTNIGVYDTVGRAFTAGVRFNF